ncbi:hypothetical protein [Agrobacterium salinitolerans]|uniref:Uncharacterized protein n=1 Tax=Agrobacterium salinitolerans TaxID=1183413 RepID=A0A9X3QZ95_9HYPH|nr:hypothetical protein [Agrobacterium salinitolerans]MCZ7936655.1 hypothetical protein [Agrobacterium salinitolerans]
MFNKNLAHDVAVDRLNDISQRCFNSGHFTYMVAKIDGGNTVDSIYSGFDGVSRHSTLMDRLSLESKPIQEFLKNFGSTGNQSLLVFEGSNTTSPERVWEHVASVVDFEALDVAIMESRMGEFDASLREHLYFLGFPDLAQKTLFIAGFYGQDLRGEDIN